MINCHDDIYDILEIHRNATQEEIKKQYKKLILKYHPDKTNEKRDHEKFIKIQYAYEILTKKNNTENDEMRYPMLQKYFNKILSFMLKDEKYKYYIDNNNYYNAFTYFMKKKINNEECAELDITHTIKCKLMDRYNNKYVHLHIKRETRKDIELYVSLRDDMHIIYDEGEMDEKYYNGDIVLQIETIETNGYYCKNHDIFKEYEISKCDYDSNCINIKYLDDKVIKIDKKNIIDDNVNKYIIFENLGLPKNENIDRGDFICFFVIKE